MYEYFDMLTLTTVWTEWTVKALQLTLHIVIVPMGFKICIDILAYI